ncbi:deoxyribodipyrimidine photo-lyase [Acholeplasma vituli]|uniref:Deoxyribodipyrimidine photo-lyase n=1 Tax=Paracholeplasma vituli TaxID=69473 RepID=A0ABT2PXC8_9MOLU|nr:deoxyribodipyrimidine photo-lyase [Paracholeplasma vituli]MCU0105613.1 deoxyribodipyrimidine photo-lyase [Paracholeplasma vituli]
MNTERVQTLYASKSNLNAKYVLYWMQQSQRIHYNHALERAVEIANKKNLPVLVLFVLDPNFKEANQRHYQFMLEGLKDVFVWGNKLGFNMVSRVGNPVEIVISYLSEADTLIFDQAYLKYPLKWRYDIVQSIQDKQLPITVEMVDTDLIVPVRIASNKVEYGAYTLRPKLHKLMDIFIDFKKLSILINQSQLSITSDFDFNNIEVLLNCLNIDDSVKPFEGFIGGYLEAMKRLNDFITNKIAYYPESSDPSTEYTSLLSPYLHFGQISSLEIVMHLNLFLQQERISKELYDAYVEQLFVRRELAFNYCYYNPGYDDFNQMTEPWAYETMRDHEMDIRTYIYTKEDYLAYKTHDPYFNAAMKEMVETGFMHNYMRMYWAKKIIEWSKTYKEAYETTLYLNNKYFLDGRDPNSYTGVAWCFGKHDRAWTERSIFGKLRYMNDKGLERKFDMQGYINKVEFR